ncbi:cation efflux protein [Hesseltinella vesiculosa]|uniref:Cation efflux protein n=1 Tax=Hesseltinella vesiculosa TaxID=101127 RepID=A0A1X2GNB8_9FUNG|nr:cation efflux protein [Hesseltinella vesiculosa]
MEQPRYFPRSTSTCSQLNVLKEIKEENKSTKKRLLMACSLAFLFFLTEVAAGYLSNSLALLSDGFHLLTDVASFVVAISAIYFAEKNPTNRFSFGFHRAEVVAALFSVFTIWVLTGYLVIEAIRRVYHPPDINAKIMCVTATIGVLVNICLAFVLGTHHHIGHHHHQPSIAPDSNQSSENSTVQDIETAHTQYHQPPKNINLQAAALHVIGDLLASLGVLTSSIILLFKPEYGIVDPMCTFFFSIIVMYTTFHLVRDSLVVLMEGVPNQLQLDQIELSLLQLKRVVAVHDLHIWTLSPGKVAMTAHVVVEPDLKESDRRFVLADAQSLMHLVFGIHHTTFQIEIFRHEISDGGCH